MTVSLDEALGLLKKWQTESSSITVVFTCDGVAFTSDGFITKVTPSSIVVQNANSSEFIVDPAQCSGWEYQDVRDAPEGAKRVTNLEAVSLIGFHIGECTCCFFETPPANRMTSLE